MLTSTEEARENVTFANLSNKEVEANEYLVGDADLDEATNIHYTPFIILIDFVISYCTLLSKTKQ